MKAADGSAFTPVRSKPLVVADLETHLPALGDLALEAIDARHELADDLLAVFNHVAQVWPRGGRS